MPGDARAAITNALEKEVSPYGIEALRQLAQNADIASETRSPICQDTGMAVVFLEIGQDVHFTGGDIKEAVFEGVRNAYKRNSFRKSVLTPLTRKNTGDNTPAVVHMEIVPGDKVRISAAPKGFGSENMSAIAMLTPSQGREGVINFVEETVRRAGANPCPPIIVGVGVGGTFEYCALLAKKQLLRPVGEPSPCAETAELERELLERVNKLGIGPQGLGGKVTALAVHAALFETHIAGLPVAVNIQCHAARHTHIVL